MNRLRSRKCDSCCDACATPCCGLAAPKAAEPIAPPKDGAKPLPPGVDKPKGGEVNSIPQPVNAPALEVAPRNVPANPF